MRESRIKLYPKTAPLFFLLLLGFFTPKIIFAQTSEHFFEYAPDPWQSQRHDESSAQTAYQLFTLGQSVELNGLDLWLDNPSTATTISITLAQEDGTALHTQTETLPVIPTVEGGTKFHIDLDAAIPIFAGDQHSIQISSPGNGLGIYYANRLNFLSHNQDYTSEFSLGAARLGTQLQDFTFKFALYKNPNVVPGEDDDEETDIPPPPGSPSITNARTTNITDTVASFAWTTNVAATTVVKVRSQLNPLFIYTENSDPTLELEHSLSVSGLFPGAFYFADLQSVFSTTTLSTTLAFQTLTTPPPGSEDEDGDDGDETDGDSDNTDNGENNDGENNDDGGTDENIDSDGDESNNGIIETEIGVSAPTNSGGSGSLISFSQGENGGTTVSWSGNGANPSGGFRIDIFDHNNNLVRQSVLAGDQTSAEVSKLNSGVYSAIVYANEDGEYTKAAKPTTVTIHNNPLTGALTKTIGLGIFSLASIGGFVFWRFKKEKTSLTPEEGFDPNSL